MARGKRREKADERLPSLAEGPPQNFEAEQAVLSAMLVERGAITTAAAILEARDFYSAQHGELFRAMLDIYRRSEPVDLTTVEAELDHAQFLEMGGVSYLVSLQDASPSAVAIRHYAALVLKPSILRQQLQACETFRVTPDEEHRFWAIQQLERTASTDVEVVGVDELLAQDIEVEMLVDPIIPLHAVTILAGSKDMGKSLLALSLCHAVANNLDTWLGKFRIERHGGALYIDAESGPRGMRQRVIDLDLGGGISTDVRDAAAEAPDPWEEREEEGAGGEERPQSRPLGFLFRPKLTLGPEIASLENLIREWKARLVVFDSLSMLKPIYANMNAADDMARLIDRLTRLATRTNCAIVLIHHKSHRKAGVDATGGEGVMGSVQILNQADSVLIIEGTADGRRYVIHDKKRLAKKGERSFWLESVVNEKGVGTVLIHGGALREEEAATEKVEEAVMGQLGTSPTFRQELIGVARDVSEASKRTVERVLKALESEGRIEARFVDRKKQYRLAEATLWE